MELFRNPFQRVPLLDFYLMSRLNGFLWLVCLTFVGKSVKNWLNMTDFFIIIEVKSVITIFRFLFLFLFLLLLFLLLHCPDCDGWRAAGAQRRLQVHLKTLFCVSW